MLNTSASQLRQVAVANLDSPVRPRKRRGSSYSNPFTPPKPNRRISSIDEAHRQGTTPERPGVMRRRSTRLNTSTEPAISRYQRLETAVVEHTFESFFVIKIRDEVVYVSEILPGMAPFFLPFTLDNRSRQVDIVLYVRQSGRDWKLWLSVEVDLTMLIAVDPTATIVTKNTLLLQFDHETWYQIPPKQASSEKRYIAPRAESYSTGQILRLQSSTEFINDALHSVANLRQELDKHLERNVQKFECSQNVSRLRVGLDDLSRDIRVLRKQKTAISTEVAALKETIALRKSLLKSAKAQKQAIDSDLAGERDKLHDRVPAMRLMGAEITRQQRHLTRLLCEIYPIETTPQVSRIRGLRTARDSEYLQQSDEEAAALGYIAHFIFLLSLYLSIPLRYPIRALSSHSYVLDPVSILPSSSDAVGGPPYSIKRDRRYPLFFERGGQARLAWAVFLLNKDIEQLLQASGLVCGDLRHSLHNLEALVTWLLSVNEGEDGGGTSASDAPSLDASGVRRGDGTGARTGGHVDGRTGRATDAAAPVAAALDDALAHLEITDHDDLLAARLRTRIERQQYGSAAPSEAVSEKGDGDGDGGGDGGSDVGDDHDHDLDDVDNHHGHDDEARQGQTGTTAVPDRGTDGERERQ